jgi:hypothetical protein
MERITTDRVVGAVAAGAGLLGLLYVYNWATETGPNHRNEYEVVAEVDEINDDSFHITDITIIEARGSAPGRLENDEVVHDNFQNNRCIGNQTSDDFDDLVDSGQLDEGDTVRVKATVGHSYRDCAPGGRGTRQDRSILEALQIVDGQR